MAERVLKVKTVSEVAESIAGLTDLSGSLRGVGTAALEAAGKSKAAWKEAEAEWQKSNPTLKGVAAAAFEVESALNKMGRAGSASQLETGLVKAQVALNRYKAKLEEVRASGGTIDEGMRQSLAVMESSIQAGTMKLAAMREETERAKTQIAAMADEGKKAGESAKQFGEEWRKAAYEAGEATRKAAGEQRKAADEAKRAAEESKAGKNLTFLKQGIEDGKNLALMFAGAVKVIQEIDRSLGDVSERYGAYRERIEAARTAETEHATALAAVDKGLITAGATIDETARKWESYRANVLRAEEGTDALAKGLELTIPKSFKVLNEEFSKFNTVMQSAVSEGRFDQFAVKNAEYAKQLREEYRLIGESVPADLQKVIQAAEDYARAEGIATEAKERSKNAGELQLATLTREWEQKQKIVAQAKEIMAAANEEAAATGNSALATERANKALADLAAQYGISVGQLDALVAGNRKYDEVLKDVAKSNDTATSAELARARALDFGRKSLEESIAAYDRMAAAAQRARDQESAAKNFSTPVTGEYKAIQDAAVGAAAASGQFGTSLDVVAQKVVSLGGELRVGTPVLLNLAEAEDRVVDALYRRLEVTKLLREEQEKSLDVADGWLAYIANIEDSMARGITSTTVGINLLADLQRQIQTFYAGATGDTKKMIDDVLDAIRALIATADGGGVLDVSPLANLEREIDRKKRGR